MKFKRGTYKTYNSIGKKNKCGANIKTSTIDITDPIKKPHQAKKAMAIKAVTNIFQSNMKGENIQFPSLSRIQSTLLTIVFLIFLFILA